MASTVTASTMTVTISESITLNGKNQGGTQTLSIPSIATVSKRIVNVPTSEVEIAAMGSDVASGTFVQGDVRYIRITNLDDANNVFLTFKNSDNDEFAVLLDYGQSFIYNSNFDGGVVNTFDANTAAEVSKDNLGTLSNITAQADTGAVDLELFVASV